MKNNENTIVPENTPRENRAAFLDSRINANAKIAADSIVAVGRDLKEMRDKKLYTELNCASFEEYCNEMTPIKQRQAYNFIKCYEKYGERLAELSDIGITKLTLMSALDDEDSDALIESGELEKMSVKELKAEVERYKKMTEQLTLDMEELKDDAVSNETDRGVFEEMRGKMEATEQDNERLKSKIEELEGLADANNAVAETIRQEKENLESELDELEKKLKELENKPVEVAVAEPSKEKIAEIEKKAAEKAKKAAKKQHDKELAELREKSESERRSAVEAAKKANLAEIERLRCENAALQSSAKKAPPTSEKERIKICLEEVQRNFNVALETIGKLPEEEREKLKGVLKAVVEKMGGLLV